LIALRLHIEIQRQVIDGSDIPFAVNLKMPHHGIGDLAGNHGLERSGNRDKDQDKDNTDSDQRGREQGPSFIANEITEGNFK
jgi:hypothetical protein